MRRPRCDEESGEDNGREGRAGLIAAIPSSISEGDKKKKEYLTIFLTTPQKTPALVLSPFAPCHPPLPSIPPSCTLPLLSFTLSLLSSAHPSTPPPPCLSRRQLSIKCVSHNPSGAHCARGRWRRQALRGGGEPQMEGALSIIVTNY